MSAGPGFFTGGVSESECLCSSVAGRTETGGREAFFLFNRPAFYRNPVFLPCYLPHPVCSVHSPEGVCRCVVTQDSAKPLVAHRLNEMSEEAASVLVGRYSVIKKIRALCVCAVLSVT